MLQLLQTHEFSGDYEIDLLIEIKYELAVCQSVAHVDCFPLLCGIAYSFRFTLYTLNLWCKVRTHLEL
jgi:hypothetical protein